MNPTISNIFVVVYAALILLMRIMLEPQLQGQYLISIGMGAFSLLFLWALIKSGFLRPTILGLDKFGPRRNLNIKPHHDPKKAGIKNRNICICNIAGQFSFVICF